MVAYTCPPLADGAIPDYATRRKIERQVGKSVHEHLIIYTDGASTAQVWQWVRKEIGKPAACREHHYYRVQPGDSVLQKLQAIAFSLEEEEGLTIVDVTSRVRAAFDVERVTRRFYDRFKTEHAKFLDFIKGIPDEGLQRWYASVMLNRLMFIYFIEKKRFLNDDDSYLQHKLVESKARGRDRYYSEFLCPLFFEGFARKPDERSAATNKLLGAVPYLNGGIFMRHQVEQLHGETIRIADAAFDRLFAFFEQYHWHLDERPLRADNEINPDVLGYIFEKYINQKELGAYYSKEDITGYISQNTIIPRLFDTARAKCRIAFEGDHAVWALLQADPDRYIYEAVRRGADRDLPPEIAAGIDDVSKRGGWNTLAPPEYALPTEIWREVVARRQRYGEVRGKLLAGEVRDINDLITLNLDIPQFAQDVIENCEGPDLLNAFWQAIESITVLDPAVGSGAFLFAALNILESLYEAFLDRMEAFLDEWGEAGRKRHPNYARLFNGVLERVRKHPNRKYFVFKSIIVNNLYGVDIMEEAVEICKLRLFLKLAAQVELDHAKPNFGIEPLPDIDFSIRAGNSLVGYATYGQVKQAVASEFDYEGKMKQIEEKAQDVARLFARFREQQTELGGEVAADDKQRLRDSLRALEDELNDALAGEYAVDPGEQADLQEWLASHKPFHWFIEFYGTLNTGGFDVVIGNPPYLEVRQIDYETRGFRTGRSRAVHAMFMEQATRLTCPRGCISMIVPLALVSTQRMTIVQQLLEERGNAWFCNFSWRPGKLFDTVNRALTIFTVTPSSAPCTFSTGYQKWTTDNRNLLMAGVRYVDVPRERPAFWVPKTEHALEACILTKILAVGSFFEDFMVTSDHRVYYRTDGGLYWKVFTDFAPAFRANGRPGHSSRETTLSLKRRDMVKPAIAILSSDIFWWWYTVTSNCRHLNPSDIKGFPVPSQALDDPRLADLGEEYVQDLERNSTTLVRMQRQTGRIETQSFKVQKSKHLIDMIDSALAEYYGLSEEELDFIINYDIKYRMGLDALEDEDE